MTKISKIKLNKIKNYVIFSCLVVVFWFSLFGVVVIAQAATLSFSPAAGSYDVGTTFSISVYVSSADQAMNAASGVISFPSDKLAVTSLSKVGSIFSLWVQKPVFSNSAGTINFEGIVLNPGFIGKSGKIIAINFRVKAASTAKLDFFSGSVLANDGKGTNILTSLGNAQFGLGYVNSIVPETLKKEKIPEKVITPAPVTTLKNSLKPQVISSTHPNSDEWYNNKNPQFSWVLPVNVNGVSIYFSQSPTSNPGPVSDGFLTTESYKDVADGVWYFHIKMRTTSGWGPITHFKIQIDTQSPEPFKIKFVDGGKTENPRPVALFNTTDALAGIDYYKVKIGAGDFFPITPEIVEKNPYILSAQLPGKRSILVQAFDKAGNYTTDVKEFEILAIRSPVITDYPKKLQSGEPLVIHGLTYANSKVNIWLQREKDDAKNFTVNSDQAGRFTFIIDKKLTDGIYKMWVEVINAQSAKSLPTDKVTVIVEKPAIFRIGNLAVKILAIVIPLVALIFVLLIIVWWGWRKFLFMRKRLKREVHKVESTLYKAFNSLKDGMQKQIRMLEKTKNKRRLTVEEEKLIKHLKKDLNNAEKFIGKEIENINKKVG